MTQYVLCPFRSLCCVTHFRCLVLPKLKEAPRFFSNESFKPHIISSKTKDAQSPSSRIELLSDLLQCSRISAANIVNKHNKIVDVKAYTLTKTIKILRFLFPVKDILLNPEILTFQFGSVEQRFHVLQEMGFRNLTCGKVLRYKDLVAHPACFLKRHKLMSTYLDPAINMISYLDCPESVKASILSKLPLHYTVTCSLNEIKAIIQQEYLSWALQCTVEDVKNIYKKYRSIRSRSLQFLQRNIEILQENFQFSLEKIRSNGFLLLASPDNLENILSQVLSLGGMNVRELAHLTPRILTVPSENLIRIERALKMHHVTNEQIQRCTGIYTLGPDTIESRLEELNKVSEFEVRKSYPRMLNLVYYLSKAKYRLELLQNMGYLSMSLDMLSSSSRNFKKALYSGGDRNYGRETFQFLASLFNKCEAEVKFKLCEHPCAFRTSLLNAKKVTDYLLSHEVRLEQLWSGLPIILYDIETVSEHFEKLPYHEELHPFSEWKNSPYLMQLLIYYLELETRFTGITKMEKMHALDSNKAMEESYPQSLYTYVDKKK